MLEEAADYEGVGFRVEGVELGGDVGLRADDVELRLHYLVGLVVLGRGGFWVSRRRRKSMIFGKEKEDGLSCWDSGLVPTDLSSTIFFLFLIMFFCFFIIFKIDKFIF